METVNYQAEMANLQCQMYNLREKEVEDKIKTLEQELERIRKEKRAYVQGTAWSSPALKIRDKPVQDKQLLSPPKASTKTTPVATPVESKALLKKEDTAKPSEEKKRGGLLSALFKTNKSKPANKENQDDNATPANSKEQQAAKRNVTPPAKPPHSLAESQTRGRPINAQAMGATVPSATARVPPPPQRGSPRLHPRPLLHDSHPSPSERGSQRPHPRALLQDSRGNYVVSPAGSNQRVVLVRPSMYGHQVHPSRNPRIMSPDKPARHTNNDTPIPAALPGNGVWSSAPPRRTRDTYQVGSIGFGEHGDHGLSLEDCHHMEQDEFKEYNQRECNYVRTMIPKQDSSATFQDRNHRHDPRLVPSSSHKRGSPSPAAANYREASYKTPSPFTPSEACDSSSNRHASMAAKQHGFLGEIQQGVQLKKVDTTEKKKAEALPSTGSSLLAELKARRARGRKAINDDNWD